ncbi:DEAD/DEAH box helicase [Lysobacter antibioticus]|uniref:DEAD/DEAH box helicase n=1 Tax=Lysobacter antibioticus TaxID=84531 RepID=UPI0009E97DAB|nr:DEAD/DEAH box helicase [Lysobacter antibioticus]
MTLKDIVADSEPQRSLAELLRVLHEQGPDSQAMLENLSLYKEFHPAAFSLLEEKIVASMGLFYKIGSPESLYSFLIARMGASDTVRGGGSLTPVQASMRRALQENQFISISAPTSAGKSYSIRDFIANDEGDAVIVVPSRALIAEYMNVMRSMFQDDKRVMVMPFVDRVFTSRELRRIFILTPERARDLFELRADLNIRLFFFDEAQVSEERPRGIIFDVLVRRVSRVFSDAKLVFAHPFVENPGAQFAKHGLPTSRSYSRTYPYGAVGKLYVFRHSNGADYYFSPFEEDGHHIKNSIKFDGAFDSFAFGSGHSVLAYVTKGSIYSGKFLDEFKDYIDKFDQLNDPKGIEIIQAIEHLVGADQVGHDSKMVELMRKGVVIHHGSVPLEVRFLVEDFVRAGFAKICFATSTLVQGVNMPFDIVWLDSMRILGEDESSKSLAFKNLIGRAGRLSKDQQFDFGYVFTKSPKILVERLLDKFILSEDSVIEDSEALGDADAEELLSAIREGTFDDELHVPQSKAERLSHQGVLDAASRVLNLVYADDGSLSGSMRGKANREVRVEIERNLRKIYESSLGRSLVDGERAVFKEAISLMLQTFQGRSFSEIVGLRFSRVARRDQHRSGQAEFTQHASKLPDSKLVTPFPLFPQGTAASNVSYDAVVFDTYDYLDQVISFCLSDTFVAAFKVYHRRSGNDRALKFIELLRFGTNDPMHVLLMRYGFLPEDIESLLPYIRSVNEKEIAFTRAISYASARVQMITAWYR